VVCIFRVDITESRRRGAVEVGEGRALVDSCTAGAPSGAMVASMVDLVRGFGSVYQPGDRLTGSGGGDFWRNPTRRYLWIVLGSRCSQ
jgi:hypothetical protein